MENYIKMLILYILCQWLKKWKAKRFRVQVKFCLDENISNKASEENEEANENNYGWLFI